MQTAREPQDKFATSLRGNAYRVSFSTKSDPREPRCDGKPPFRRRRRRGKENGEEERCRRKRMRWRGGRCEQRSLGAPLPPLMLRRICHRRRRHQPPPLPLLRAVPWIIKVLPAASHILDAAGATIQRPASSTPPTNAGRDGREERQSADMRELAGRAARRQPSCQSPPPPPPRGPRRHSREKCGKKGKEEGEKTLTGRREEYQSTIQGVTLNSSRVSPCGVPRRHKTWFRQTRSRGDTSFFLFFFSGGKSAQHPTA